MKIIKDKLMIIMHSYIILFKNQKIELYNIHCKLINIFNFSTFLS